MGNNNQKSNSNHDELQSIMDALDRSQARIEFKPDGTIITANNNFLHTMGYDLNEIKGQHHSMFIEQAHKESDEYRKFWVDLKNGNFKSAEYKRIAKGGREVWIQASYNPIFDEQGNIQKVIKLATDVTESAKARLESEAKAVENARIRTALDGANTNLMIADKDRNIIYVNRSVENMLKDRESDIRKDLPNFDASNLIGTCVDSFHKRPEMQVRMLEGMTSEHNTSITVGGIPFGLIANPIFNEQGERTGTSVEWEDLTEQRAFEEQAQNAMRIQTALDGASTNMMMADETNRINYVNQAVVDMLKRNEQEIRKTLPNFSADNLVGTLIDDFHKNPLHQRSMLEGMTSTYETNIKVGILNFDLTANPIFDKNGERLGTSVEWRDVTEQLRAEAEIESIISAAGQGNLSQRLDSAKYNGFLEKMASGLNALLDTITAPINELITLMQQQAQNDVSAQIETDYQGSFQELKDAYNQANRNINSVLQQATTVMEQVASSVSQLRQSSQSLASGAEEQSSAVEEVSSNLAETDSQVKSNAENASVASQLATDTGSIASEGQNKMSSMTDAMSSISDSSDNITKIIKVIDDIAFQTNLLALNAAVEAARAGQHGKGFAVVAQEVRNLAARSAKAAKETADLIDDSGRKVQQGVTIVEETSVVLGSIVENVMKVKDIVAEIAAASDEQTKGINQINKAMSQVSTAANSSSQQSLELASASDQLASLTDQLKAEIGRFELSKVSDGANGIMGQLPNNMTPEMLQQIMSMLQQQTGQPQAVPSVAGSDIKPEVQKNMPAPSSVLPLDKDERGFGDF